MPLEVNSRNNDSEQGNEAYGPPLHGQPKFIANIKRRVAPGVATQKEILAVEVNMKIEKAISELNRTRTPISALQAPSDSGVYAFYLKHHSRIKGFRAGDDGLIYIGSTSNLAKRICRKHFNFKCTGSSTLRRSLGAILKKELALVAIPRSPGASKAYKFSSDGEQRLTDWMKENLEVGVCPIRSDYESIEKQLLTKLQPILNLKGRDKPDLEALRKMCAEEAKQNRAA